MISFENDDFKNPERIEKGSLERRNQRFEKIVQKGNTENQVDSLVY